MVLPENVQSRVIELNGRLDSFIGEPVKRNKARRKSLIQILHDTCLFLREETKSDVSYLSELVEAAHQILDKGVSFAYGDSDLFDFMPSWAHDDAADQPLIKESPELKSLLPAGAAREMARIMKIPRNSKTMKKMIPDPWSEGMKSHPKSSLIARVRPNIPALTPTTANPLAISVYNARCEASSARIFEPMKLHFSQNNACLALIGAAGYKNRAPGLCYYNPNETGAVDSFHKEHYLEPGLGDIARHMAIDEGRRLIFVGDGSRVKSYAWGSTGGENYKDEPHPTHTLQSDEYPGPIAVLPNGTIVRAGQGKAAVWSIDELETHGESGQTIIGEEDEDIHEYSERDSDEYIETSTGSSPTSEFTLSNNLDLSVAQWEPLPQASSTMVCYPDNYQCFTLDLEHGGAMVSRYLGHGGKIGDVSVSRGGPQMFLTACSDGFARLFDLRTPLPVVTFDACGEEEFCNTAVLAHPDGIPTVFTGTGKSEQIKMWDVRARTPVYELATGNNRVNSLAWDSDRNCLYAATECSYKDRLGYRHDYRYARKWQTEKVLKDDRDPEHAWPKDAYHDENYFGYAFDAGENRIYRYAFKEDPDTSQMPPCGDACVNEASSRW